LNSYKYNAEVRGDDSRGKIISMCDANISNVSFINSAANTIRSNHYHYKDSHYMYVISGELDYFYSDLKDIQEFNYLKIREGECIYTPPMEYHVTYFPKDTSLIVCSVFARDQQTYESDTVKDNLINLDNIQDYLKKFE